MKSNEEILEEARALVAREPYVPPEDPGPSERQRDEARRVENHYIRERARQHRAHPWLDDLEPDERELRLEATGSVGFSPAGVSHHSWRPGGWMPYGRLPYALVAYIAPHPGRPDAWEPLHNLWEEPDERELRRQKAEYDRYGDYTLGGSFAGDWIPCGRVPYELIPDEDELVPIGRVTAP